MLLGPFNLAPPPDRLEIVNEEAPFRLTPGMAVYLGAEPDEFVNACLADIALAAAASLRPEVVAEAEGPGIYAGVLGAFGPFASREMRRALSTAAPPGPGGYALIIEAEFVALAGADEAGLRQGWRTLVAMVEQSPALPQLRLADAPAVAFRAVRADAADGDVLEGAIGGRADAVLAPGAEAAIARYGFAAALPEPAGAPKPAPGQIMVRAAGVAAPVTVEARASDAFSRIDRLIRENPAAPLIVDGTGADGARIAAVLLHAWNPDRPLPVWEAGLNGLLGATLDEPDATAIIDAVFAYANRAPHEPLPSARTFESALKDLEPRVPADHPDVRLVVGVYRAIGEYLALESAFKAAPGPAELKKLLEVVAAYSALDPQSDGARAQRIAEVVQGQKMFVPPSVLFGRILFPHVPMAPPSPGAALLPYGGEPVYDYGERQASATFAFGVPMTRIARIDYEAAGVSEVTVEAGTGPSDLQPAGEQTLGPGVVTGPFVPAAPLSAAHVRMTALGASERSTLRSAIALAWKDAQPIRLGALTREPSSGAELPIAGTGFVLADERMFAAAQSVLRGGFVRDGLVLAVEAYEPRMATMESLRGPEDSAIAEREAVEVTVLTPSGRYVFGLNPAGVRMDAKDGDAAWDGEWDGDVRAEADRWIAVFRIPFSAIGGDRAPTGVNAVRYRYNVQKETSALAIDGDGAGSRTGVLSVAVR